MTTQWSPARLGNLSGKRIIVTGATNGVGLATARSLAGAGAQVILAVRNLELGAQRAAEIGGDTSVLKLDLADQRSVRAFPSLFDGDVDILLTTNNGPAYLFRNDVQSLNKSLRLYMTGTKSNRDAIGTVVRIFHAGVSQMRVVRSGSSYLSQSERALTFGVGKADQLDRVTVEWPSGATQEFTKIATRNAHQIDEHKGLIDINGF